MCVILYQVKSVHGKGRTVTPATPPGEVSVIPITKLTSSLKVAEVIEQLRQNLTSTIPPVIDKESLPGLLPVGAKTTSMIISQPQQLKSTPTVMSSVAVSETKIVGPVTPPSMIAKASPISKAAVSLPAVSAEEAPREETLTKPLPQPKMSEAAKPTDAPVKTMPKTTERAKPTDSAVKTTPKKNEVNNKAPPPTTTEAVVKTTEAGKPPETIKPSEIALRTRRKVCEDMVSMF